MHKKALENLKPGDPVIVGRHVGRTDQPLAVGPIRRVLKVTAKHIVLDRDARYRRDTGVRIGGVRDVILRVATPQDFEREEAKREQQEDARKQAEAMMARRESLANLFPSEMRPTVGLSDKPERFNLEFYNLTEDQIRQIAKVVVKL